MTDTTKTLPRPEKVATVDEIAERLSSSAATVFTEYRGLTVADLKSLRVNLKSSGASYKVYKNTLAKLGAKKAGVEVEQYLTGPTAIVFVSDDAVTAAKTLVEFGVAKESLVIKGGFLGTVPLAASDVIELSKIEPREVLLAKMAGAFKAPMVKAAGLFSALQRNTAYAIKALIEKRESEN